MHPALDIVTGDAALPREVDTVVIGGGIIGVCTALSLVERGQKVALCEKGVIGAEQSGRNWGWVRRMGRDLAEFPLGVLSLELWAGMNARVGGETGFTRSGIVYAAETPAELAVIEGYKRESHPKIEAHRVATGHSLIAPGEASVRAVASDEPLVLDRPVFDLDDTARIADFILAEVGLQGAGPRPPERR